jgi:hypothetical protein
MGLILNSIMEKSSKNKRDHTCRENIFECDRLSRQNNKDMGVRGLTKLRNYGSALTTVTLLEYWHSENTTLKVLFSSEACPEVAENAFFCCFRLSYTHISIHDRCKFDHLHNKWGHYNPQIAA